MKLSSALSVNISAFPKPNRIADFGMLPVSREEENSASGISPIAATVGSGYSPLVKEHLPPK